MKRFFKILLALIIILIVIYMLGPTTKFEKVNNIPFERKFDLQEVQNYVNKKEAQFTNIKPDNQSQFIWKDSLQKTAYSVVYLHGFSASHGEAYPILQNFAERYQTNTYMPRLCLHGLSDVDAFKNLTPKKWVESAKEAIAIGKAIGHKLIIISTSTGSTLATYLAANDPDLEAVIMTSPNIDLFDTNSHLLVKPWGKEIFKKMMKGNYRQWPGNETINKYWTTKNRIEAHVAIRELLNQTMTDEIFKKITLPVFIGYYYKNEEKRDKVISINAIDKLGKTISTPKEKVTIIPFATAKRHVISSSYMNNAWEDVQNEIFKFTDKTILGK